jgi:glycosyltransferase involved in cell wall biosynthesis
MGRHCDQPGKNWEGPQPNSSKQKVKKVLVVVSTWKPCMMADMQRARLIAGELPKFGWEAEILTPDADFQTDFSRVQGEGMEFPDVPVHEVKEWNPGLFKTLGVGNVGLRAAWPMWRRGLELLQSGRFDLVYFTTTKHWLTCLGAAWRRRTGVPYVADLHDPVFQEKRTYFVTKNKIKERAAIRLGWYVEKLSLGRADGLVSVSPGYVEDLARRQAAAPWRSSGNVLVQAFPADLAALSNEAARQPDSDIKRIIYIGAGGNIMEKGFRELLECLPPSAARCDVHWEILGTDTGWRKGGRRYLQDIAAEYGLGDVLHEEPGRIAYQETIARIKAADGLLVLCVDDPNYRPSKLQTYLATGLPLLVTVHADSALRRDLANAGPGVHVVLFGGGTATRETNRFAVEKFLGEVKRCAPSISKRSFLAPRQAAEAHARLFDKVATVS